MSTVVIHTQGKQPKYFSNSNIWMWTKISPSSVRQNVFFFCNFLKDYGNGVIIAGQTFSNKEELGKFFQEFLETWKIVASLAMSAPIQFILIFRCRVFSWPCLSIPLKEKLRRAVDVPEIESDVVQRNAVVCWILNWMRWTELIILK